MFATAPLLTVMAKTAILGMERISASIILALCLALFASLGVVHIKETYLNYLNVV